VKFRNFNSEITATVVIVAIINARFRGQFDCLFGSWRSILRRLMVQTVVSAIWSNLCTPKMC